MYGQTVKRGEKVLTAAGSVKPCNHDRDIALLLHIRGGSVLKARILQHSAIKVSL